MNALEGRAFFVTGGASGIGLAVARLALQRGARACIVDRDREALARAAKDLGSAVHAIACDVADAAQVAAAVVDAAARMGRLDAVVNAAGVDHMTALEQISDAEWARTLAVNLTGPMLVCRAATPHLRRAGGGTIVNVSSAAGLVPLAGRSPIARPRPPSSCSARRWRWNWPWTTSASMRSAPAPWIRPSFARATKARTIRPARSKASASATRCAAWRSRKKLAEAVLYLSSAASSYVTGTAHAVDGGRSYH
jgi:NAD(P)-dependent dehydrogenase (short-subunit alcohol dehydrogenase family)